MKRISAFLLAIFMVFAMMSACSAELQDQNADNTSNGVPSNTSENPDNPENTSVETPENFILINGGTFEMGSPNTEAWRSDDETQHTVTVSDFYMSIYELTQAEYRDVTGENPSTLSSDVSEWLETNGIK